jgi:menaquinone-dependent protoporphyrinogen oxidase
MRVLIVFATTEGHTREICQFAANRLREAGHTVAVEEATPKAEQANVAAYDAVILAGSLHVGRFQAPLVSFAASHRDVLASKPSAFISVSLSAAGEDPHDWEGLDQCLARFQHETGWTPRAIHNAAGAIKYSHYDFFKRLAIKHIAARRGQSTVTTRDYDLTDYEALGRFVTGFVQAGSQAGPGAST